MCAFPHRLVHYQISTLNNFFATSSLDCFVEHLEPLVLSCVCSILYFVYWWWHFISPLCCFNGEVMYPPVPAWVVRSLLLFKYSNSCGLCVCIVCVFIPYIHPYRKREYPQNRKWLSIDWRCTSFELILFYFSQDVYLLLPYHPLPPTIPTPFLYGDTEKLQLVFCCVFVEAVGGDRIQNV